MKNRNKSTCHCSREGFRLNRVEQAAQVQPRAIENNYVHRFHSHQAVSMITDDVPLRTARVARTVDYRHALNDGNGYQLPMYLSGKNPSRHGYEIKITHVYVNEKNIIPIG
jgi:hypothetical protein